MTTEVLTNPLYDESRRLREDDGAYREEADRREPPPAPIGRRIVGRTVNGGSYPTAAQRFYKMEVVSVTGDEVEGGAPTLTLGGEFFAVNLGTAIPAVGTDHVVSHVPWRFVFRHD